MSQKRRIERVVAIVEGKKELAEVVVIVVEGVGVAVVEVAVVVTVIVAVIIVGKLRPLSVVQKAVIGTIITITVNNNNDNKSRHSNTAHTRTHNK